LECVLPDCVPVSSIEEELQVEKGEVDEMTIMKCLGLTAAAAAMIWDTSSATAQQPVTLRIHHYLAAQAPVPSKFMTEWTKKIEAESNGRIKFEQYPSMQLGGTPPQLFDQVKDGVVDIVWTLPGYTSGRFPRLETLELPFIAATGEQTSQAAWDFYEKHARDELKDVKVLAVATHGPAAIHMRGNGIRKLEDMKGVKLRGPSRVVTDMIKTIGATPVGMPLPAVPESLSKGVIDGAAIAWEVVAPLRIAELTNTHTTFGGNRSLYVLAFILAMNKSKYDGLPADLKKVIDDNSGMATAKWLGRVIDEGDKPGIEAVKKRNNAIVELDVSETARWKAVGRSVIAKWIEEMKAKGIDGNMLVQDFETMVAKYAGPAK
jgi:TRAP-type C4-dicarboxylate transport system substrate-binding protein